MTVQEIVVHLLAGSKGQDTFDKFWQVVPYLVLGIWCRRAGMQVNDPGPRPKGHHRRLPGVLTAGQENPPKTPVGPQGGEVPDINAHGRRLTSSPTRPRRALHAEQ